MQSLRNSSPSNGLNLVGGHSKTLRRQDIAEKFNSFFIKLTFLWLGIEAIFLKPSEDFLDLSAVSSFIRRVN
jgi:hypothetical protein